MIEARDAVQGFRHQVAAVDGDDDLMVALGAELLAQELAMAGRCLPVDGPGVESRGVLAQRLELGAVAEVVLDLQARNELPGGEETQRGRAHSADVGHYGHLGVRPETRLPADQPEGPGPADPYGVHPDRPAAQRHQRNLELGLVVLPDFHGPQRLRRQVRVQIGQDLER